MLQKSENYEFVVHLFRLLFAIIIIIKFQKSVINIRYYNIMEGYNPVFDNLFTVGDCVKVDGTMVGWIIAKQQGDTLDNTLLSVRFILTNTIEHGVKPDRVTVVNYDTAQINRSGYSRSTANATGNNHRSNDPPPPPSPLVNDSSTNTTTSTTTPNPSTSTNANVSPNPTQSPPNSTIPPKAEFDQCLKKSFSWLPYKSTNPLYVYLKEGLIRKRGWLREVISQKVLPSNHTELNPFEGSILTVVSSLFSGYSNVHPEVKDHSSMTQHAFDIGKTKHKSLMKYFVDSGFTNQRKVRTDKGTSVFNCDKKRKWTYTAFNTFKKRRTKDFRETTAPIPISTLKEEYESLSPTEKHAYQVLADRDLQRSEHLWEELKDVLVRSKGKISYERLSNYLGGIVGPSAIRNWLRQQPGFRIRRDRILPHLDSAAKCRRVIWAHSFWLFWKSCRLVDVKKAIFILVHMDEKWFYAVRSRNNCKVLTSIGLEPSDYYCQHKNHIGKEMYIVVTGFVLRNNDITAGGTAVPVSCVRVGKMVTCTKDSYKRVYKDDGTFHYPRIPANMLRKEGEQYFKSLELTGSSEGTAKKPKISLLKVYKEIIIPDIEEKLVRPYSEGGTRRVIIVKQEDGAGLHTNTTYQKEMEKIFNEKGWLNFKQASQSPVTNVHDACIFPMMSRDVSAEQALEYGSTLLKGEQLYKCVMKVWNNEKNIVAMSRAFANHSQIVTSIIKHEGDNKYLSEKGGLSFGIRRTFVTDIEGTGVVPISLAPTTEGETTQGEFLNERIARHLRYEEPTIESLDKAKLTSSMITLLAELMDRDRMNEEMKAKWDSILSVVPEGNN